MRGARTSEFSDNVAVNPLRGFILQASYRVVNRDRDRVPVVHLYGRMEDGSTFLIRDDRQRPHFYIKSSDAGAARSPGVKHLAHSTWRTFSDEPVSRVTITVPSDVPD